MPSIFDTLGKAQSTQGGNYIRDGRGTLVVTKFEIDQKEKGQMAIVEFLVEESHKVAVASAKDGSKLDIEPNQVGSSCSTVIPLNDPKIKSGPGNLKALVLALIGETESSITPSAYGKALAELADKDYETAQPLPADKCKQPGRGMAIGFETYRKMNKAGDKELVLVKWSTIKQTGADIAARRAKLDGTAAK